MLQGCHSILNWGEKTSVSEVFAGVQRVAPGGSCKGAAPSCLRKFCIW